MDIRNSFFILLLTIIVSMAMFFAGYTFNDNRKLAASVLGVADMQNNASSSDVVASTDGGASPTLTPTLTNVFQEIQDQEKLLTSSVADIRSQLEVMSLKALFTRTLKWGDSGDDVSKLQELLKRIPGVYPPDMDLSGPVTGYYGSVTRTAVMKFQAQTGLKQTGIFDQDTKKKFYESATNPAGAGNASVEFAPIDFSTIMDLQNLDDQISQVASSASSTQASLADLQNQISQNASSTQDQISQVASSASSTQASLADLQNQVSQMASDIANMQASIAALQNSSSAPASASPPAFAVSNVQSANITNASSTITWTTNQASTSEVDYSQNSAIPANQMLSASSSALVTNHNLALLHLVANTKYYYRIISKNSLGTVATSTILFFTTLR